MKKTDALMVLMVASTLAGCGTSASHGPTHRFATASYRGVPENGVDGGLCPSGRPQVTGDYGPTTLVSGRGYTLEHSALLLVPIWVCERLTARQVVGGAERRRRFLQDSRVPRGQRISHETYDNSGWDRGHMAPAEDFAGDQVLMDESFFMTNVAPQQGVRFNQHVWAYLEEHARNIAKAGTVVHVITGVLFWEDEEQDPSTADGIVEYETIDGTPVAVPPYFYKILVTGEGPETRALALVLRNQEHPTPEDWRGWQSWVRSIDWLEERAGIDFLPELDPAVEEELEASEGNVREWWQ